MANRQPVRALFLWMVTALSRARLLELPNLAAQALDAEAASLETAAALRWRSNQVALPAV